MPETTQPRHRDKRKKIFLALFFRFSFFCDNPIFERQKQSSYVTGTALGFANYGARAE